MYLADTPPTDGEPFPDSWLSLEPSGANHRQILARNMASGLAYVQAMLRAISSAIRDEEAFALQQNP
eukprot:15088611-Heterocapsa_arctica.AAC.1